MQKHRLTTIPLKREDHPLSQVVTVKAEEGMEHHLVQLRHAAGNVVDDVAAVYPQAKPGIAVRERELIEVQERPIDDVEFSAGVAQNVARRNRVAVNSDLKALARYILVVEESRVPLSGYRAGFSVPQYRGHEPPSPHITPATPKGDIPEGGPPEGGTPLGGTGGHLWVEGLAKPTEPTLST